MHPENSEAELRRRIGAPLDTLTARQGIDAMLAFYVKQRAECVPLEKYGDMLLFQWGVYGFNLLPPTFQIDITRQFSLEGEDEPFQLLFTFHYEPTSESQAIREGNRWCNSPEKLPEFRQFIEASPGYVALSDAPPLRVEIVYTQC